MRSVGAEADNGGLRDSLLTLRPDGCSCGAGTLGGTGGTPGGTGARSGPSQGPLSHRRPGGTQGCSDGRGEGRGLGSPPPLGRRVLGGGPRQDLSPRPGRKAPLRRGGGGGARRGAGADPERLSWPLNRFGDAQRGVHAAGGSPGGPPPPPGPAALLPRALCLKSACGGRTDVTLVTLWLQTGHGTQHLKDAA